MATGDFTTTDAVVAYLQTSANTGSFDTNEIAALITAASLFIRTFCNDNFLSASYTEHRNGVGLYIPNPTYLFANRPVTAVSSVTVCRQAVLPVPTPFTGVEAGYLFTPDKIVFYRTSVPAIPLCVQLAYTAGVVTTPADIAQACIDLVAVKYRRRARIGIASEATAGIGSRTYTVKDIPDSTLITLKQRQHVSPIATTMPGST